jgi:5-methylcytosine-specific restriction endonuclease McrA
MGAVRYDLEPQALHAPGAEMSREFSKPVKREALKRSGHLCEATGEMYGLSAGQRCNAPLAYGVEFDHVVLHANSGDSSLENCAAVCIKCHKHKTAKHDTPMAAKTVRLQDKALGIRKRSTFPGGRDSPWKMKIGGRAERRT